MAILIPLVLLLSITTFLLWLFGRMTGTKGKSSEPPMVPYYIPYLGNILAFVLYPKTFIEDNNKKYGNVFMCKILGFNVVFLLGPEANDFYFNAQEENLSFLLAVDKVLGPFLPQGLFSRMRNDIFGAALSKPKFPQYIQIMEATIHKTLQKWEEKGSFEALDFFLHLTLHLNSECFSPAEINENYKEFAKIFFEADPQSNTKDMIISIIKRENKCENAFVKIEKMVRKIIDDRIEKGIVVDDFIQICLDKSPRINGEINYRDAALALYGFLFAAQTNTYGVFAWTLIHLLQNKPLYERALEEQKEVISKHGPHMSMAALDAMTFLGNSMLEAARLEIGSGTFRLVKQPQFYKNFELKKGNLVTIYTPSVHRNEEIYTNPNVFDPDRFLRNEHLKYQHGLIVFGGGPHACLGRRFVTLEIKTALSVMLRQLDMHLATPQIHRNPRQVFFVGRPTNPVIVKYSKKSEI
eukprot:Phypoly_transcript_06955.p1 GENE.Phypoly_transcript_06955~~Phypoly_transcript_06955.p1  ORF type:complete len:516 (+),score=76.50 Phypoly_transcript_06955:148-1548(+)